LKLLIDLVLFLEALRFEERNLRIVHRFAVLYVVIAPRLPEHADRANSVAMHRIELNRRIMLDDEFPPLCTPLIQSLARFRLFVGRREERIGTAPESQSSVIVEPVENDFADQASTFRCADSFCRDGSLDELDPRDVLPGRLPALESGDEFGRRCCGRIFRSGTSG
jgi:hypothetical protein